MSILTDLHHAIVNELTTKIEGIETSGFYPKIREEITAPAVFVDMVSLEPGQDPGTGEVAYIARFEARFMVGTSDEANLQVRELAAEGGRIIYKNSFGLNVKAAELLSVGNDGFNPELDAYEVWIVEWEHERLRWIGAAREQMDAFLRNGRAETFCDGACVFADVGECE